ncbi:MAG: hypothetical protein ACKOOL_12310 [Novosphingobium sp.]
MTQLIARRDCLIGIGTGALLIASGARAAPLERPRAVLQKYFRLINQRRFSAAFHVWELDRGRNDLGQNLKQFAAGFAETRKVMAEIGPEGESDSGAGSEYLELPVTLTSTLRSGKVQLFEGSYMMRRSLNPGGHQDWLIYTAKLTPADRD